MDWIALIITGVLGIGVVSLWAGKIMRVLAEVKDVLVAIVDAGTDGTVTSDEIALIIKEAKDVPAAISKLLTTKKAE